MAPLPPLEDLIPLADVARRLRLSRDAVHDWRCRIDNPLACWKLGHRWYTTEAAIEAFVRTGTDPAPVEPIATPAVQSASARGRGRNADREAARKALGRALHRA